MEGRQIQNAPKRENLRHNNGDTIMYMKIRTNGQITERRL
jgi:hypothetical protein